MSLLADAELSAQIANTLRFLAADGVQKANSGHPGLPMGCAEIAAVLLTRHLRVDPHDAKWINRDRFVLSAGHGSMLLYGMLHLLGYLELDELKNFRQLHSRTPGHPEYGETPGVDMTSGPLGAGFSAAVGMALAERMLAERHNTPKFEIMDHFTYVLMGDGCHMEGVSNEAASLAGHLKLGRLIAIYDDNHISIEGDTALAFTENVGARYDALGWHVQYCDGHDLDAVDAAIAAAQAETGKPSLIAARTTIGKGAPSKAGAAQAHGEPLGAEEIAAAKKAAGWPEEAFHVPAAVRTYFTRKREELSALRDQWNELLNAYERKHRLVARGFRRVAAGELPLQWKKALPEFPAGESVATRVSGGKIMNAFGAVIPELVGGSADLTPSTKTDIKTGDHPEYVGAARYLGRNLHFGVREHAMGGALNGMALHGGLIPYGSTFMVFHDYMRPPIRLAALMKIQTITVYTHDSIFVGEDGPTHQPVEHLAALRAIPGVRVWRPADANECAFAWQAAIERRDGPTILALSRQNMPTLDRTNRTPAREALRGGYILSDDKNADGALADLLLIATGSEVALALETAEDLKAMGRGCRVVSMPCLEAFAAQSEGYRKKILPRRFRKRVVLEAGIRQGWEGYLGELGVFIGMSGFGVSGKASDLARHFGFTRAAVMEKIKAAGFLDAPRPPQPGAFTRAAAAENDAEENDAEGAAAEEAEEAAAAADGAEDAADAPE